MSKTATVSLHANSYEVDPALAGRRVELVFDPFDLTRIEVRYQRRPFGLAIGQVIGRHTHPKAKNDTAPPAATGIDYLRLLDEQRAADQEGYRIDYAGSPTTTATATATATATIVTTGRKGAGVPKLVGMS